ncbi:hypothetical protein EMCRGX_G031417 [Ephydatia muelleri]|eukprot:Em0018g565a
MSVVAKEKKSTLSSPLWKKALIRQDAWDDKEEFLDAIYWLRQVFSAVLGIIWGIIPLQGFIGMGIYLLLSALAVYLYFSVYQRVDEEEYGGTWELLKEGFMTSFSLFLVNWIISYSAVHFG